MSDKEQRLTIDVGDGDSRAVVTVTTVRGAAAADEVVAALETTPDLDVKRR